MTKKKSETEKIATRIQNWILQPLELSSIAELAGRSAFQLLRLRNVGHGTILEVQRLLRARGLSLSPELKPVKCPACGRTLTLRGK